MNQLPFSLSNESLTIFVGGLPSTFRAGTVQYNQLREAILKDDWLAVPALMAPGGALAKYLGDKFNISPEGEISYEGVALPDGLNNRVTLMAGEGLDPSPLLRFYERLHRNPSYRSREQVFDFLRHLDIAIEPDGTFLAYKGINDNYTDVHTGTVPNNPGQTHTMARNLISDDPDEGCHYGFHVGALEYARGFGRVVVICRVDPEHVVCVPKDYSFQKMRVCKYEVVGEWSGETLPVNVDASDLPESDEEYEAYEDSHDADGNDPNEVEGGEFDDADISVEYEPWLGDPTLTITPEVLTRGDLAPGTIFEYKGVPGTFAVDNVKLPGAPKAEVIEYSPFMMAEVIVIWAPDDTVHGIGGSKIYVDQDGPAKGLVETETIIKKMPAPRLDKLDTKGLMKRSIEDLRRYASGRLKILGASKITGGKSALVSKIMQVRRRKAK